MTSRPEVDDTDVLDPDLPVIDCHHHLWHAHRAYFIKDFATDLATGHTVLATVYIECGAMYRRHGPEALRSVGEVEFAAGQAAMSESGQYGPTRVCAVIIGAANLTLGDAVDEVLDALSAVSGGRFRGIRGVANWDADPSINTGSRPFGPPGLLSDTRFRAGFARLAARGHVYDAFQYYPQLPELCGLADAFPEATIVVNHCGGLLGIGPYARTDNFARWKECVGGIAKRPNALMKLGGLAGRRCGFAFEDRVAPATTTELAALWRPYIETCIELFGPDRCMFESNVPPDHAAGSYRTLWNVFKLIAAGCSVSEKRALFCETARRVYAIA
jgi:L-fuconolactonase